MMINSRPGAAKEKDLWVYSGFVGMCGIGHCCAALVLQHCKLGLHMHSVFDLSILTDF